MPLVKFSHVEKPIPGPQGSLMMAQMCLQVLCWKSVVVHIALSVVEARVG